MAERYNWPPEVWLNMDTTLKDRFRMVWALKSETDVLVAQEVRRRQQEESIKARLPKR